MKHLSEKLSNPVSKSHVIIFYVLVFDGSVGTDSKVFFFYLT